ncbi:unnamed protein product [Withania somnifera]
MAVYFKYKSAKVYDSIPILDRFISVGNLKLRIFESKCFGRGKDFDLLITNAQTNQDYVDHDTLITKNTSILIRRVPGLPRLPIVVTESKQPNISQDFECNDFGDDVYAIPKVTPIQSGNPMSTGGGMEWKRPPSGYVCHRCKVPGHFIQHCPTNGDPNYDIKKVTKSMLMATPSSIVGVLKPKQENEGISSTSSSRSKRSFRDIPPELHCPLCKGLMNNAVIASKCCFSSFCDKCIRDHIMSNSVCACGARNIHTDTLLPNITLRITINRILKCSSSSSEHGDSAQHMVSAHKEENFKAPMTEENCPLAVEQKATAEMKKRKKPCDTAESYMSTMNPAAYRSPCTSVTYGLNPVDIHHILP